MVKKKVPSTRAINFLRQKDVEYEAQFFRYDPESVTEVAAQDIGVDVTLIIKTLVMEDNGGSPFLVLMHGGKQVSTKKLARIMGVKSVTSTSRRRAEKLTGYIIGGISPFGVRKRMPVYVHSSILELDTLYINGGRRGLLVGMSPEGLVKALDPHVVDIALP